MKRVFITAGASNIGLAIARAFHTADMRVAICDVSEEALASARTILPGVLGLRCDVSDSIQVNAAFAEIDRQLGGIDILVNNAGIGGPFGPLHEIDDLEWNRTISVNLSAAFYCASRALPGMRKRRDGVIINISSVSARTGLRDRGPYVVSKYALLSLTEHIAREAGPDNVRCNSILPGVVDNPRGRAVVQRRADELALSYEQAEQEFLGHVSMRTMVTMDEIGRLAVFLASEDGRHISGQHIGLCGNAEWEV